MLAHPPLEACDTGLEEVRGGHPVVADVALGVVVFLTARPSAQLLSQKRITDPGAGQRGAQRIAVEVRRVPGVRLRSGVYHDLDPVPAQQLDELLQRMVGMTDGKQVALVRRHGVDRVQTAPSW